MSRFFKNHGNTQRVLGPLETKAKTFPTANRFSGKLIKVTLSEKTLHTYSALNFLTQNVIKANRNSIFLWTIPTSFVHGELGTIIQPGHNFSSITDINGETICAASKTPDVNVILGEHQRIPDERLKNQPEVFKSYKPRYTTIDEEINKWQNRASTKKEYPLYIHVLPLDAIANLSARDYSCNVRDMMDIDNAYKLYSSKDPKSNRYIPASNCNSATACSLFGYKKPEMQLIHEQYCQEAVINIVSTLLGSHIDDYRDTAEEMGLTEGIVPSCTEKESYYDLFTC